MSLEFTGDILSGDLTATGCKGRYEIKAGQAVTLSIRQENPAGITTDSFTVLLTVDEAIEAANRFDNGDDVK